MTDCEKTLGGTSAEPRMNTTWSQVRYLCYAALILLLSLMPQGIVLGAEKVQVKVIARDQDGRALAGAVVQIRDHYEGFLKASGTTGENGDVRLRVEAGSRVNVKASKSGYVSSSLNDKAVLGISTFRLRLQEIASGQADDSPSRKACSACGDRGYTITVAEYDDGRVERMRNKCGTCNGTGVARSESSAQPSSEAGETQAKLCPDCGQKASPTDKFCSGCGKALKAACEEGSNLGSFALVYVSPGSFRMGTEGSDRDPAHTVKISRGYWVGKYEVTQQQYEFIMGSNPSKFKGGSNPVESVTWSQAVLFCRKLTDQEQRAGSLPNGYEYRLPTEAEWEYAARGGSKGSSTSYAGSNVDVDVAWLTYNSSKETHPVGQKQANELGLYDMSGNVSEWCHDWHDYYSSGPQTDPVGPDTGRERVHRGGCYVGPGHRCRVSYRCASGGWQGSYTGLRVVLAPSIPR